MFLARNYDYGRKGQYDDEEYEDDGLGMISGSDYFIRGEGSRNFTFGGRPVEERAPRDDDDDDDDDDDEDNDDEDEDDEDEDDDDYEEDEEEGEDEEEEEQEKRDEDEDEQH